MLPATVIHADWGTSAAKRWEAVAELHDDVYVASSPRLAGDPVADAIRRGGTALVGFDFPIGVPCSYADRVGVESFVELLPELGWKEWRDFFSPAATRSEISLRRPFYPRRPGGASQRHLLDALGFDSMDQLRRRCELPHGQRRAAEVLFWTLGPKQVGKAALAGWREVLVPHRHEIRIWPFDGSLDELLASPGVVVCETYPAEFYGHLGIGAAKSAAQARIVAARPVVAACGLLGIEVEPRLRAEIENGFASDDPYDAFIGLLGMINVLLGRRPPSPPLDERTRSVEGWILGQSE